MWPIFLFYSVYSQMILLFNRKVLGINGLKPSNYAHEMNDGMEIKQSFKMLRQGITIQKGVTQASLGAAWQRLLVPYLSS